MPNCFMIRSSPALVMLARLKWLMKQSAIKRTRMRQRLRAGSASLPVSRLMTRARSSKSKVQSSKEIPRSKHQNRPAAHSVDLKNAGDRNAGDRSADSFVSAKRCKRNTRTRLSALRFQIGPEAEPGIEVWSLKFHWCLDLGAWGFSSPRFRDETFFHEFFVQGDAQAGSVRHGDPAVFGLQFFPCQLVPHWRVIDTILEDERVAAGRQPMQAGGHRDGTSVTMVAEPGADFFHPRPDVRGIGESVPRNVHLINVQGVAVDQRPERLAPAFFFARSDRHGRTVPKPDIPRHVTGAKRFLQPANVERGKRMGSAQGRARVPDTARVDQ